MGVGWCSRQGMGGGPLAKTRTREERGGEGRKTEDQRPTAHGPEMVMHSEHAHKEACLRDTY